MHLKASQTRMIEDAFAWPNGRGWVLDFSDRTFAEFFEDEFGIDIDEARYRQRGTSKRYRLLGFVREHDPYTVAKVLRRLWEHREALIADGREGSPDDPPTLATRFAAMLDDVQREADLPAGDAFYGFTPDETLDELIADLDRDLAAGKPAAALDHLHTYVVKKLRFLLASRGEETRRDEPVHSLFARYRRLLASERDLHPMTDQAMKLGIGTMEAFNSVRNDRSFAHDNDLLPKDEARLAFDAVTAMLRFLRSVEAGRFE